MILFKKITSFLLTKTAFIFVFLVITACDKPVSIAYQFPLNEIETIKNEDYLGKEYYGAIGFTPESFLSEKSNRLQEIKASFLYEKQKISVAFRIDFNESSVSILNLGEESNLFLTALSSLFEEHIQNPEMKEQVVFYFDKENTPDKHLPKDELHFDLKNNETEALLVVNLQKGSIKLMEKNAGLTKQSFVKAFEKEY